MQYKHKTTGVIIDVKKVEKDTILTNGLHAEAGTYEVIGKQFTLTEEGLSQYEPVTENRTIKKEPESIL